MLETLVRQLNMVRLSAGALALIAMTGFVFGNWDTIVRSPLLWHFNFRGPDVERLVQGRERIYLDRFWNELSADPKKIDEVVAKKEKEVMEV